MINTCFRRHVAAPPSTLSAVRRNLLNSTFGCKHTARFANHRTMSTGKRIVFTGGSGKAGRHVIPDLMRRGHQVLNLDLVPLNNPDVFVW